MATSQPDPSRESLPTGLDRLQLGKLGEEFAAAYVQQLGYRLVAANFTMPVGRNKLGAIINVEIDLVAYDGPILCFIEVKTRSSDWFAAPSANVDLHKQRQITRAARTYRRILGLTEQACRYDVVSVVLPAGQQSNVQIELLRSFWTEEKFRKRRWTERYWD